MALNLITRNLQEVLHQEKIEEILAAGKAPKVYWGTAPTGKPHCGYLVPMTKLADLLKAGCEVVVLMADLHAFLDNMKAPESVLKFRVQYYETVVKAMLRSIGVSIDKLTFKIGSSYQLSPEYTMDLFRMANICSQNDARRAGAEVVKQTDNPALSGLMYPLMQALDEQYLDVDMQFGGVDQRKIFVLAEEYLPKLGYKQRAHLMNPMVPGLAAAGGKMSASDPNSKIDLTDDPATVKKKIAKAYAAPGVVEGNGLLGFLEYVVLPISDIQTGKATFHVNRDEKWGGPLTYHDIAAVKADYASEKLSPADLKIGMVDAINAILEPLRKELLNPEFAELEKNAYPPVEETKPKKEKKKKNKGTMHPGARSAEASAESAGKAPTTAQSASTAQPASSSTVVPDEIPSGANASTLAEVAEQTKNLGLQN